MGYRVPGIWGKHVSSTAYENPFSYGTKLREKYIYTSHHKLDIEGGRVSDNSTYTSSGNTDAISKNPHQRSIIKKGYFSAVSDTPLKRHIKKNEEEGGYEVSEVPDIIIPDYDYITTSSIDERKDLLAGILNLSLPEKGYKKSRLPRGRVKYKKIKFKCVNVLFRNYVCFLAMSIGMKVKRYEIFYDNKKAINVVLKYTNVCPNLKNCNKTYIDYENPNTLRTGDINSVQTFSFRIRETNSHFSYCKLTFGQSPNSTFLLGDFSIGI